MTPNEILASLEARLAGYPPRYDRLDVFRQLRRVTEKFAAADRSSTEEALRAWLLRTDDDERVMLAVDIACDLDLGGLRPDIESLLTNVRCGRALLPYYEEILEKALSRLR